MAVGPANRREFLVGAGGLFLSAAAQRARPLAMPLGDEAPLGRSNESGAPADSSAPAEPDGETPPRGLRRRGEQLVVSTWNMGMRANPVAWDVLRDPSTVHPIEACEAGVRVIEADPKVTSVGYGGNPNAEGTVELDAAIMRGDTLECGAVGALQRVMHPISVARAVMERTKHVMLVGEGAHSFARTLGVPEQDLLTDRARAAWERWRAKQAEQVEPWQQAEPAGRPLEDHDTIGMVAFDRGRFGTAVTTSGMAWKLPGRVGDSPIIGAGSYCDDLAGAAVSSGDGEEVIRTGGCLAIVEAMRRGIPPRRACAEVLGRIRRSLEVRGKGGFVGFIAVSRAGEVAGMALGKGFQFAFTDKDGTRLYDGEVLS
jgi:isoaspartyl peptidase/L-asparaginase-like protein (Ntn-hydrolase superfamily)